MKNPPESVKAIKNTPEDIAGSTFNLFKVKGIKIPARLAIIKLHNMATAMILLIMILSGNIICVTPHIMAANNIPLHIPTVNSLPITLIVLREVSSLVAKALTTTANVCCPVVPPIDATIGIKTAKVDI